MTQEPREASQARSRTWMAAGAWIAGVALVCGLVVAALAVWADGRVAQGVHDLGTDLAFRKRGSWGRVISEVMKTPGEWYFVAGVVALIVGVEAWRGRVAWVVRAGVFVVLAAVLSFTNTLVKWVAGRQRPFREDRFYTDADVFDWFHGGVRGLFSQSNLSFVSGHASQSFAVGLALTLLYPRWGWVGLILACMTGAERVLSNSHYLSEVVGGGMLGSAGTLALWAIARRWGEARKDSGLQMRDFR